MWPGEGWGWREKRVPAMSTYGSAHRPAGPGILLVDDEPRIQDFISRALSRAGYAIDCASGGTDALRLFRAGEYCLVILDLLMPDMDGREVLDELLRANPDQAVLVLSCLDDVTTKVACLDLGAHDYLTKPFSLEELLARGRVHLRGDPRHGLLRSGELSLDVARRQAVGGQDPTSVARLHSLLLLQPRGHSR